MKGVGMFHSFYFTFSRDEITDPFPANPFFLYHSKYQKTKRFLRFSGSLKRKHKREIVSLNGNFQTYCQWFFEST